MKSIVTSGRRPILLGGLVAGTLDVGAASLINRVSPDLILHYIASGVLGRASFSAGVWAACLGLLLQWAMSVLIAAIYWRVTAGMPRLRERWWLGGLLAGVVTYLVMNFIVMPFSAAPVTLHQVIARFRLDKGAENLLAMILFGSIIAYCARTRSRDAKRASASGGRVAPLATILLPLCLLPLCCPASAMEALAADPVTLIASARQAIESANARWLPAMERGDAAAVAADYADDGVLVTAKGEAVRGRSAIAALYQAEFAKIGKVVGGGLVQEGVTVSGGLVYEWGHGWIAFQKNGERRTSSGPYFTVWRRGPKGHWRIARNLVL